MRTCAVLRGSRRCVYRVCDWEEVLVASLVKVETGLPLVTSGTVSECTKAGLSANRGPLKFTSGLSSRCSCVCVEFAVIVVAEK